MASSAHTPSSSSSHAAAPVPIACTVPDFEGYIQFRILDSVAYPGTYKKFMLARKEQVRRRLTLCAAPYSIERSIL